MALSLRRAPPLPRRLYAKVVTLFSHTLYFDHFSASKLTDLTDLAQGTHNLILKAAKPCSNTIENVSFAIGVQVTDFH